MITTLPPRGENSAMTSDIGTVTEPISDRLAGFSGAALEPQLSLEHGVSEVTSKRPWPPQRNARDNSTAEKCEYNGRRVASRHGRGLSGSPSPLHRIRAYPWEGSG
jgi:hypothetical protein